MKWRTSISTRKDGELYVRGRALGDLMLNDSFSASAFLVLSGRKPTKNEQTLFDMILVSCIEHGVEAPSAFSARVSASVGNPMNAALAAGLLATGDWHGGAIEEAARLLASEKSPEEIVRGVRENGKRLAGFGHKIYKDADPRAEALFARAKELGCSGAFIQKARALGTELEKQTGKKLPLNIDMAIAALMCEMKLDWRLGKAIFAFARMPGMIAHAHEEMVNEKPYRRLDENDVEYTGPAV